LDLENVFQRQLKDTPITGRENLAVPGIPQLPDLDSRHRTSLPTIIAGDFNASPGASCIRYISGLQSIDNRSVKYHDAWAVAGEGSGHTWTIDNPNARLEMERIVRQPNHSRRLDYVFVGSWDAHPNSHCRMIAWPDFKTDLNCLPKPVPFPPVRSN